MNQSKYAGGLQRMLLCEMPPDMRQAIEELLAQDNANEYVLKSAYERYAKRLVLARPREEIEWNPTVDSELCAGCGICFDFCPHSVYDMVDGVAAVARPTQCVILCSNCMSKCPAGAISFPEKKNFVDLLQYH